VGMLLKRRSVTTAGTWDCGYVRPTARMQYTGSSLGQMVVDMLGWALWPKTVRVRIEKLLPRAERFERNVPDAILDRVLLPAYRLGRRGADAVHGVQQGSVQAYLAYVLVILLVLVLLG
jgi:hydrogenase-4 component B